jgi:hypothetical protein
MTNLPQLRRITVNQDHSHRHEPKMGYFHQWGNSYRPTDSGSEFPVLMGVVEYQDGTVQMVEPHRIKFHD